MKNLLPALVFLTGTLVFGQISDWYDPMPTVTFKITAEAPSVLGTPLCGNSVGLTVTGYNILSVRIAEDSLILTAEPESLIIGPILMSPIFIFPYDTIFVFNQSGKYQAYLNSLSFMTTDEGKAGPIIPSPMPGLTPLSGFRIYPALSTVPVYPIAGEATTLNLTVGQTIPAACPPSYTGVSAVVESTTIRLSYTELPNMTLMACLDTIEY